MILSLCLLSILPHHKSHLSMSSSLTFHHAVITKKLKSPSVPRRLARQQLQGFLTWFSQKEKTRWPINRKIACYVRAHHSDLAENRKLKQNAVRYGLSSTPAYPTCWLFGFPLIFFQCGNLESSNQECEGWRTQDAQDDGVSGDLHVRAAEAIAGTMAKLEVVMHNV